MAVSIHNSQFTIHHSPFTIVLHSDFALQNGNQKRKKEKKQVGRRTGKWVNGTKADELRSGEAVEL